MVQEICVSLACILAPTTKDVVKLAILGLTNPIGGSEQTPNVVIVE